MPHAPGVLVASKNLPNLPPIVRIHHVAFIADQHSEAVVGRPRSARRVDDENLAVAQHHLWAFADRETIPLPIKIRSAEQHAATAKLGRTLHPRDIKILLAIDPSGPAGP